MDEQRRHRGVHAAAESADDASVADLAADRVRRFLHERRHRPVAGAAADVVGEVAQDVEAVIGVCDFGMKQERVEPPLLCHHRRNRRVRAGRRHLKAGGRGLDEVAVARPHAQVRRHRIEERRPRVNVDGRQPELAVWGGRDLAAERVRHELHAVANAEHRNAGLVDARFAMRRAGFRHALRSARQHDARRAPPHDLVERGIERKNFRVHRQLAQATRNQLREL